jgi:immune inhibitor A
VTASGTTLVNSGAETSPEGWTLNGYSSVGSEVLTSADNYYIASHINYLGYDENLSTGPFDFGFGATLPDKVAHFPYQDGLLVWYWDTSQIDNNTSEHPGEGLILPIDSHPAPITRLDGKNWRPRIGGYDAPFGLDQAATFTCLSTANPIQSWARTGPRRSTTASSTGTPSSHKPASRYPTTASTSKYYRASAPPSQ